MFSEEEIGRLLMGHSIKEISLSLSVYSVQCDRDLTIIMKAKHHVSIDLNSKWWEIDASKCAVINLKHGIKWTNHLANENLLAVEWQLQFHFSDWESLCFSFSFFLWPIGKLFWSFCWANEVFVSLSVNRISILFDASFSFRFSQEFGLCVT